MPTTFTLDKVAAGQSLTISTYNANLVKTETAIRNLQNATTSSGTVTSVGLVAPNIFSVSGSPITSNGNLTFTLVSQSANRIFASPNGSSGAPTFRSIVLADLPTITPSKGGNGLTALGTAYQLMRVNSGATANEYFSFSPASSKITLTPSVGALNIDIDESSLNLANMGGVTNIANGGTGANTAQNAIKNLTQASSGTVGYYYTLDASKNPVWTAFPSINTSGITNNAVTYGKIQTVGSYKLIGNPTNASANASEIGVGSNLLLVSNILTHRNTIFRRVSTNTTITNTDGIIYVDATAAARTILLPDTSTLQGGEIFAVQKTDSGAHNVTIRCFDTVTDTINGGTESAISVQYGTVWVQYLGTISGTNTFNIINKIP